MIMIITAYRYSKHRDQTARQAHESWGHHPTTRLPDCKENNNQFYRQWLQPTVPSKHRQGWVNPSRGARQFHPAAKTTSMSHSQQSISLLFVYQVVFPWEFVSGWSNWDWRYWEDIFCWRNTCKWEEGVEVKPMFNQISCNSIMGFDFTLNMTYVQHINDTRNC